MQHFTELYQELKTNTSRLAVENVDAISKLLVQSKEAELPLESDYPQDHYIDRLGSYFDDLNAFKVTKSELVDEIT